MSFSSFLGAKGLRERMFAETKLTQIRSQCSMNLMIMSAEVIILKMTPHWQYSCRIFVLNWPLCYVFSQMKAEMMPLPCVIIISSRVCQLQQHWLYRFIIQAHTKSTKTCWETFRELIWVWCCRESHGIDDDEASGGKVVCAEECGRCGFHRCLMSEDSPPILLTFE